jgi:ABC-type antimicrobial peptide transport system permease subunit
MVMFAATAVSIGVVGMYGVGVHSVRRQHRDIGVRMALGATQGRVTREVLSRGLRAALIGVPPGLLLAFAVARSLDSLLFGISASDPRTPLAVAVAMLLLTAGAFLVPARLAAAIEPAGATRDG